MELNVGDDPVTQVEALAAPLLADTASDVSDSSLDAFMVCVLHINRTRNQESNVVPIQYIVIY